MARRSSRRSAAPEAPAERSVASHVRDRQRAVAEREASRLARPETKRKASLAHADRKKSAVSSTPTGIFAASTQPSTHSQEWCGPFSVARQMIAKREEARRAREEEDKEDENAGHHPLDEVMEELEVEKKRKEHPSMQWKGGLIQTNKGSLYSKRQKRADVLQKGRAVPSLFNLCIKFLVDNFEYVESLGDIDSQIRTAISNELIATQTLDGASFETIAEEGIEALEIVDCSGITETELTARLEVIASSLRYISLDQAGRCFGSKAAAACSNDRIFALSIGGAYMLKDADAASLVKICQPSAIGFKACPLLGAGLCESISGLQLVELALEDLPLSRDNVKLLSSFQRLKNLSLRRIEGLDDTILTDIVGNTCATLEGLDISDNPQLSDSVLAGIRLHAPRRLHTLDLTGLQQLTNAGLQAFFTFVESASPPPMLRTLILANCDHEAVTDEVIELALAAATQSHESDQHSLHGGLVYLNVQGSSVLTDTAMERLVVTSANTLEHLNASFCPLISDKGLGYLVDKCYKQLSKIEVWGNAQITDEFLDGNRRSKDPGLEIVGVWMKQNNSRTIR